MGCTRSRGPRGFQCLASSLRSGELGRYPPVIMKHKILILLFVLAAASQCFAQESNYRFDLADAKYYEPVPISRDAGGLVIAGTNFSSQIRRCETINGISIAELERRMRPGNIDENGSIAGFLGKDEELLDVLVADNDFVRRNGFTHRQLAIPLLQISDRAIEMMKTGRGPFEFKHAGTDWRVESTFTRGFQLSPFDDGTKTRTDFTVTNLQNDVTIKYSRLVLLMIERYGFYEGNETSYRVDPGDIIKVLGLNVNEQSDKDAE